MQTFLDLIKYRFVLNNLVAKNLKTIYRNMALSFLWSILNPLVMVVVLSAVWIVIFHMDFHYPSFVLIGLVIFNYFSYCLNGCTVSIVQNVSIVKKVAFPRQILPISVIFTHLLDFGMQSTLFVLLAIILPPPGRIISLRLLWLFPLLALFMGLCIGCGFLVSSLNVKYRDVKYIVESSLTILFWLCPILYDPAPRLVHLPSWVKYGYYLNPLAGIIEAFRNILYYGRHPDALTLGMAIVETLVIGIIGVRVFWVQERTFCDYL